MKPYPPHEIARADQHYAAVARDLEALIAAYRENPDLGAARNLDVMARSLALVRHSNALEINSPQHVGTLANMLAVAVDRLAGATGG